MLLTTHSDRGARLHCGGFRLLEPVTRSGQAQSSKNSPWDARPIEEARLTHRPSPITVFLLPMDNISECCPLSCDGLSARTHRLGGELDG